MGRKVIVGNGPTSDKSSMATARCKAPTATRIYFVNFSWVTVSSIFAVPDACTTSSNSLSIFSMRVYKSGELDIRSLQYLLKKLTVDFVQRPSKGRRRSYMIVNDGQEFFRIEGFCQEGRQAAPQPLLSIKRIIFRRQHDHRNIL